MKQNTTAYLNLKQMEQLVWRKLQETFSHVMQNLLEEIGSVINIFAIVLRILLNILVVILIILAIINWFRKKQEKKSIPLKILMITTIIILIMNVAVFILAGLLPTSTPLM